MNKLNYNIHLLLNNKYFFIYKLIILLFIYIMIYNKTIVFCMNENSNSVEIPSTAEAKESVRPSHQVLSLRNEIQQLAGSQTQLLEELELKNQIIEQQNTTIKRQQAIISSFKKALSNQEQRANMLEVEINGNAWRAGYKQQITKLQQDLNRVSFDLATRTNELKIAETLIAEAKEDKA